MINKAVFLTKIGKVEIIDEKVPLIGPGQAIVQVKSSGICGSDLHYFLDGGLGSFLETLPMPIGHEPAGIVVEKKGIEWIKEGDRVEVFGANRKIQDLANEANTIPYEILSCISHRVVRVYEKD